MYQNTSAAPMKRPRPIKSLTMPTMDQTLKLKIIPRESEMKAMRNRNGNRIKEVS